MENSYPTIVLKFGGTSVSSEESVRAIAKIAKRVSRNHHPVIVVSALSGITNLLLSLTQTDKLKEKQIIISQIRLKHEELIDKLFNKTSPNPVYSFIDKNLNNLTKLCSKKPQVFTLAKWQDAIVAYGETMSSFLISTFLNTQNLQSMQVIATQCIITDDNFGNANFIKAETIKKTKKTILPIIKNKKIPVITGFIGATLKEETTTLGRGGSDYSAAIIGYALNTQEIQIWTDVNGVYSSDPRLIKKPKLLANLSYQEASELAMFGAKVLHPKTILPAITADIPVRVLNTFNLKSKGTLITRTLTTKGGIVKAVTSKNKVPLINIYSVDMLLSRGFLKEIFTGFAKYNISVDLVSASEVSVSVTLDNTENLPKAIKYLGKFAKITELSDHGSISLVGENIMQAPHLMSKVFSLFEKHNINIHMVSYSAANINIGLVMPSVHINKALELLHKKFIK